MRKRAVGLGLVVLAMLALAGCGGNTKRLTAAQLTAQGNAVCTGFDAKLKAVVESFPPSLDFPPAQMQDFWKKLLPLVDDAIASFKALTPPKDLEVAYRAALDQFGIDRRTLEGGTQSPAAAKNLFDTGVDPFTATNQKLATAGITACGGTPEAGSEPGASSTTAPKGTPTTAAPATPTTTGGTGK